MKGVPRRKPDVICFAWNAFPQYAARLVGAFARSVGEPVAVVATHPSVPIRGMEEVCGCDVTWIECGETRSIKDLIGEMPRCIFLGGWNLKPFARFRDQVRLNGGTAIVMCDSNWPLSCVNPLSFHWWRTFAVECAKSVRFRLRYRSKYDAFFVPGKAGVRLLRFYGVLKDKIFTGLYAADNSLFFNGAPLTQRGKKVLYVGQLIKRKNVIRLARAFIKANEDGDWTLDMYGSGPLKGELESLAKNEGRDTMRIHGFLQPEELAAKYREARIFCLPSLVEQWGLVVHEAALSGCVLLLGNGVGAASDMLVANHDGCGYVNGRTFNPHSTHDMEKALSYAMRMVDVELAAANAASTSAAKAASVCKFVDSACALTNLRKSCKSTEIASRTTPTPTRHFA